MDIIKIRRINNQYTIEDVEYRLRFGYSKQVNHHFCETNKTATHGFLTFSEVHAILGCPEDGTMPCNGCEMQDTVKAERETFIDCI